MLLDLKEQIYIICMAQQQPYFCNIDFVFIDKKRKIVFYILVGKSQWINNKKTSLFWHIKC